MTTSLLELLIAAKKNVFSKNYFDLKNLGPRKFGVQENFESEKIFGSRKFWVQENFGSKKMIVSRKCGPIFFWISEASKLQTHSIHLLDNPQIPPRHLSDTFQISNALKSPKTIKEKKGDEHTKTRKHELSDIVTS